VQVGQKRDKVKEMEALLKKPSLGLESERNFITDQDLNAAAMIL
jgi:hypothetical protein